jgi:hypothetical protein
VAWDSTRPVPWQRLAREWLVYVAVMGAIFLVFLRDRPLIGIFAGLLASGPLYLAFGYVLAKFGYQRKTIRQLRAETPARSGGGRTSASSSSSDAGPRPRPAPTKRTGGGSGRRPNPRKRRR